MKNKTLTAILALFFGIFGVHRFYLGQRFLGVLYIVAFFIGLGMTIASRGEAPFVLAPMVLGFIDFILFLAMPREDFDERYNKKVYKRQRWEEYQYRRHRRPQLKDPVQELKSEGIRRFRDYDYEAALDAFEDALKYDDTDPALHFNAACCYSIFEESEKAFYHIEQAIKCGFNDFRKIHTHDAFAYLRALPQFDKFVQNNYSIPKKLPKPLPDVLGQSTEKQEKVEKEEEETLELEGLKEDLLDKIVILGELKERGILTAEEFQAQKKKLLGE